MLKTPMRDDIRVVLLLPIQVSSMLFDDNIKNEMGKKLEGLHKRKIHYGVSRKVKDEKEIKKGSTHKR